MASPPAIRFQIAFRLRRLHSRLRPLLLLHRSQPSCLNKSHILRLPYPHGIEESAPERHLHEHPVAAEKPGRRCCKLRERRLAATRSRETPRDQLRVVLQVDVDNARALATASRRHAPKGCPVPPTQKRQTRACFSCLQAYLCPSCLRVYHRTALAAMRFRFETFRCELLHAQEHVASVAGTWDGGWFRYRVGKAREVPAPGRAGAVRTPRAGAEWW